MLKTLYAECDGVIEYRTIRKGERTCRFYFGKDDTKDITAFIRDHWDHNIYFGVATRDGNGGKKENVKGKIFR